MVSASDTGSPVMTATSTVYVNVIDVNDNRPECGLKAGEVVSIRSGHYNTTMFFEKSLTA